MFVGIWTLRFLFSLSPTALLLDISIGHQSAATLSHLLSYDLHGAAIVHGLQANGLTFIASLRVVADAEDIDKDRGKRKHDEEETVSSSWTETGTGGFLPNFGSRKISEVATIEDYKKVVVEEPDLLVCVRFFAPWCRACKAVSSRFQRLANEYPKVKFVECPLTKENAYLHQGLGVPSLPYAHIYHPTAGLVEERKINKNVFAEFKNKVLKSYLDGSCPIEYDDEKDGKESLQ
uniref:Thioredoxin domain-containing protein n=1 Tax=Phaeodactylum tricornutum TaxID=2850 RepID=A0A8J9SW17_PHATR